MRLAIFSDIHGNLEALEAFISHAAAKSVDQYICLGDIVGYGANPNECFDRLGAIPKLRILLGNHDSAAIWQTSPYEMSPAATKAILWTMDQLGHRHTDHIKQLDKLVKMEDLVFCHANPINPTGWRYMTTWFRAMRAFLFSRGRVTFVGHTHCPKVITRQPGFKVSIAKPPESGRLKLTDNGQYIINCGSIGQPRDGNPQAGYVIFDTDKDEVNFYRFLYDIDRAAKRIVDAGLPSYLAKRLFKGR